MAHTSDMLLPSLLSALVRSNMQYSLTIAWPRVRASSYFAGGELQSQEAGSIKNASVAFLYSINGVEGMR